MFIDISDCQEINRRREHNNKNKRKQKKGKKQNKKKGGGRGGKEEIKTENDGKQTKDWGEWKERDHYKINTKNSGNQLK